MDHLDALIEMLARDVVPALDESAKALIGSARDSGDDWMVVDDILQFSLRQGVRIAPEPLDAVDDIVGRAWDPGLKDRTHTWITRHREKTPSVAA